MWTFSRAPSFSNENSAPKWVNLLRDLFKSCNNHFGTIFCFNYKRTLFPDLGNASFLYTSKANGLNKKLTQN